jgi:hypothetical protein
MEFAVSPLRENRLIYSVLITPTSANLAGGDFLC